MKSKKKKADRLQVRIDKDLEPKVRSQAKANSRYAQGEVNHILRTSFKVEVVP